MKGTDRSRLVSWYSGVSITLLNVLIALLGLNVLLYGAYWAKDRLTPNKAAAAGKYGDALMALAYPGLDQNTIRDLVAETASKRVFEAYTQFKDQASKGKYLNVHEAGFRISRNQAPWPPAHDAFNVFLFGGSTTFSVGLPDDQTVGSFLQEALSTQMKRPVHVYNFGRTAYQSTQERILFQELLVKGYRPNIAMFIDGLNDFVFRHVPSGTAFFVNFERDHPNGLNPSRVFADWPMGRLAASLHYKLSGASKAAQVSGTESEYEADPATLVESVARRYLANKRQIQALATEYGVRPIFVWQPVPFYKYDITYHVFYNAPPSRGGVVATQFTKPGYELMKRILAAEDPGRNFLWCADIQEQAKELLYVDLVHYNATMSGRLAKHIALLADERGLLAD
jgi:hypothetical protein